MGTKESCTCDKCKSDCLFKPGWFMPDEIAPLAEYLSLTIQETFDQYLLIDWWVVTGGNDIYTISPCVTHLSPGGQFTWAAGGKCVFYKDERCAIHPVKPFECREALHDTFHDGSDDTTHEKVAMAWKEKQMFIKVISGEEPKQVNATLTDLLNMFIDNCGASE